MPLISISCWLIGHDWEDKGSYLECDYCNKIKRIKK